MSAISVWNAVCGAARNDVRYATSPTITPILAPANTLPASQPGKLATPVKADTYELIRKRIGRLARAMGERLDSDLSIECAGLAATKPDIDWQDPAQRREHLGDLVELAAEMLATATMSDVAGDPEVTEAARLLAAVVLQDVTDTEARVEIADGVARDRIVSHSDPEMRHGRKSASRRFDGHKLDVIVDEDSELVLGVDVRAGNAGDDDGAAPLLAQVQATDGVEVETLLG